MRAVDFQIDELTPLYRRGIDVASNCGGACHAG
jgi:hypothetical protein